MAELMLPEDAENNSYQHLKKVAAIPSTNSFLSMPGSSSHSSTPTANSIPMGGATPTMFSMAPAPIQAAPPPQAPGSSYALHLSLPHTPTISHVEPVKPSPLPAFSPGHLFL